MKDYASMSDFEVNQMVSAYLWGSVCAVDGVVLHGEMGGPFDPCNNPADAWPIIDDNNIALIPSDGFGWVAVSDLTLNGKSPYIDERLGDCFQHEDYSGLRAAMIVFLMMKEGE